MGRVNADVATSPSEGIAMAIIMIQDIYMCVYMSATPTLGDVIGKTSALNDYKTNCLAHLDLERVRKID